MEPATRDFLGLALAWRRKDNEGFQVLRPPHGEDPSSFVVVAFSMINTLAERVGELRHEPPASVLRHVANEAKGTMTATVAEVALAALAEDREAFNGAGQAASRSSEFIPSIFHLVNWLADQVALATGTTAEDVLGEYAQLAAAGEAGLFGDDPEE
jgi:hypothetical protein